MNPHRNTTLANSNTSIYTTNINFTPTKHTMENMKRSICRKHPKHQQSPGVCSLCLQERLSKISGSSSQSVANVCSSSSSSSSISSISSACSSNAPSYVASPTRNYRDGDRMHDVEEKLGYLSFLRKSRSMAFVGENIVENDGKKKKKKKGDGFWSKLIGLKRSNMKKRPMEEGSTRLMHSRTMREMLTTRI